MRIVNFILILAYVVLLTCVSYFLNNHSLSGIDDANIYFIYMRNWANGHGFVYNVGGEHVEGFTSLLWTLFGGVFFMLSSSPEKLMLGTNILLVTYTLWSVCSYIDGKSSHFLSIKSLVFLGLIGVTPGFIDWTVLSLMETGLWCFLLSATTLTILKYNSSVSNTMYYSKLSLLIALLVVCRPESMLVVPFFIAINAVKLYYRPLAFSAIAKQSFLLIFIFIATLLSLIAWRLSYFGYMLPNTFYAKVSSSRIDNLIKGGIYIGKLFFLKPYILIIMVQSLFLVYHFIKNKAIQSNIVVFVLFLVSLLAMFIPLYSGGDHFMFHRFIMPFLPLILLLWLLVLSPVVFESKVLTLLLILAVFFTNSYNIRDYVLFKNYPLSNEWSIAKHGKKQSEKLNSFFEQAKKMPSQGVLVAGGTAYHYKGESIDLLGLNNTKMAHADKVKDKSLPKNHASFNMNVFFELKPDLLWYQQCEFYPIDQATQTKFYINNKKLSAQAFKKVHLNPQFKVLYSFCEITKNNSECFRIFASKSFLNSLDTSIYTYKVLDYE